MPLSRARGFHGKHEGSITTYDHVNSDSSQSVRGQAWPRATNLVRVQSQNRRNPTDDVGRMSIMVYWGILMQYKQWQTDVDRGGKFEMKMRSLIFWHRTEYMLKILIYVYHLLQWLYMDMKIFIFDTFPLHSTKISYPKQNLMSKPPFLYKITEHRPFSNCGYL
jgi:hypothetical protein